MKIEGLQPIIDAAKVSKEHAREQLEALLSKPFQGPLEVLAQSAGLSMREVVQCLPQSHRHHIEGGRFIEILETVATWGEVLLIVNTDDGVFECKGAIAPGSVGMGYYNLGHGSPISGHLRHDRCRDIYCVRRSFHNLDTCSIQFFNEEGGCMFKLFVSRDEKRKLDPEQVQKYEALCGLKSESGR